MEVVAISWPLIHSSFLIYHSSRGKNRRFHSIFYELKFFLFFSIFGNGLKTQFLLYFASLLRCSRDNFECLNFIFAIHITFYCIIIFVMKIIAINIMTSKYNREFFFLSKRRIITIAFYFIEMH